MVSELKGLKFHVFMVMCRSVSKNAKDICQHYIPKISDREEAKIWNSLEDDGYITKHLCSDGSTDCGITKKGEKFFNVFNQFGKKLLAKGEYEFVISKFLYEKKEPVYSIDFPESILSITETYTKTDTKADGLEEYLECYSLNKKDYSVSNHLIELTITGKEKYENQIAKEEKEKLYFENVSKLTYENLQLANEKLKSDLQDYPLVLEERKELSQERIELKKERESKFGINNFIMMELKLKGLEFELFMVIARDNSSKTIGDINREATYFVIGSLSIIPAIIKKLKNQDYVKEQELDGQKNYELSELGKDYLNEYNQFGKALIFKEKFDLAIMKFLYEMNEPVSFKNFPEIILLTPHKKTKGYQKDLDLEDYLDSGYNQKYYSVVGHKAELNNLGRSYYENLLEEEKEKKEEKEIEKETKKLQHRSLNQSVKFHPWNIVLIILGTILIPIVIYFWSSIISFLKP